MPRPPGKETAVAHSPHASIHSQAWLQPSWAPSVPVSGSPRPAAASSRGRAYHDAAARITARAASLGSSTYPRPVSGLGCPAPSPPRAGPSWTRRATSRTGAADSSTPPLAPERHKFPDMFRTRQGGSPTRAPVSGCEAGDLHEDVGGALVRGAGVDVVGQRAGLGVVVADGFSKLATLGCSGVLGALRRIEASTPPVPSRGLRGAPRRTR